MERTATLSISTIIGMRKQSAVQSLVSLRTATILAALRFELHRSNLEGLSFSLAILIDGDHYDSRSRLSVALHWGDWLNLKSKKKLHFPTSTFRRAYFMRVRDKIVRSEGFCSKSIPSLWRGYPLTNQTEDLFRNDRVSSIHACLAINHIQPHVTPSDRSCFLVKTGFREGSSNHLFPKGDAYSPLKL
ncbi:hypothetical protein Tco_0642919 [Tanacetum coccineum]